MKKIAEIENKQNCLEFSLPGDQSYFKIFNVSGKLIRDIRLSGSAEIKHIDSLGEYSIETDGTIEKILSIKLDRKKDLNLRQ